MSVGMSPDPMSAEHTLVFTVDDDRSMCDALKRLLATVGLKAHTFGSAKNSWALSGQTSRVASSWMCDCPD